ncbi:MAG: transcription termination/antitermination protein NusA [Bdellovibrionales bacterium]|nr:transcription termination/antitermination protein NusA [Bdellovibrionales bacterium]
MSLNILSNLNQVIEQVSRDKGLSEAVVINSILQGVVSAVRKKYGTYRDIEVKYNEEKGEIELFEFKKVVKDEEFEDDLIEIEYSKAKDLDSQAHIGDQIGMSLNLKELGRIDAQATKQIIIQNLRTIEHEIIFNEFEKRKGEITSGVVRRVDPGMIVVDLDKTEAYIPRKEQIPGEKYKSGDRIQGYLLEVRQTTRGPQIIMSRTHENYLIKLFENEVPEVSEGIVKIVAAAREPGQRAKMSVYSTDSAVHPVGSCVGIKGSRVQNITQELKGERIDVIIWENDPVQYICNALAPAKISKILMDEDEKSMQIIVPDDQLSLAIGKKGQNVRLAVKLTGWNLNLISEEESKKAKKEALFSLSLIPNITETKAQSLFQYGFNQIEQIAKVKPSDLKHIPEFEDISFCEKVITSAQDLLKKYEKEGIEIPKIKMQKDSKPLSSSLKEQAEEILRKELAQLEENRNQSSKPVENKPVAIEEKESLKEAGIKKK